MLYITICCIFIFFLQAFHKRLLTGASFWIGFYFCFFVLAPLLLGIKDQLATEYAKYGITVFLIAYVISTMIALQIEHKAFQIGQIRAFCSSDATQGLSPKAIDCAVIERCSELLLVLTVVLLIVSIGVSGIRGVLQGSLTLSMIDSQANVFDTMLGFSREFFGYSIVMWTIGNNGKLTKKILIFFLIFALLTIVFSFTRVSLIYMIALFAIYKLRKQNVCKQISIMLILAMIGVFLLSIMMLIRTFGLHDGVQRFSFEYLRKNITMSIDFTRIYLSYSELVHYPVKITPLVYLKPVFAIIPRSIWRMKPYASAVEIFKQLHYADWVAGNSTGYTILGEALAAFGKGGIVIYPAIFGLLLPQLDSRYIRRIRSGNDNTLGCFLYLYFAFVFVLQAFRHGTDIALMFLPMYYFVFWLITKLAVLKKVPRMNSVQRRFRWE